MTTTNDNEQNVPETNEPLYTAADEENVAPAAEEVAIPLGGDCLEEETVSVSEATEAPISKEAVEEAVSEDSEKADEKKEKKKKDKKKLSKKEKGSSRISVGIHTFGNDRYLINLRKNSLFR